VGKPVISAKSIILKLLEKSRLITRRAEVQILSLLPNKSRGYGENHNPFVLCARQGAENKEPPEDGP
jgi:hypothetical protein